MIACTNCLIVASKPGSLLTCNMLVTLELHKDFPNGFASFPKARSHTDFLWDIFSSPAGKNLMFTDEFTASAGVLSSSRISPAAQIFTTSATFLNSLKLMEKIESILT